MTEHQREDACACCGAKDHLTTFSVPGFQAILCEDAEACLARWHHDRMPVPGGSNAPGGAS